jgi:hypothetical protein
MSCERRLTYILLLFITSFSPLVFASDAIYHGWTHLELGAGNYGPDGHTKASQSMTVLMKIEDVSNEKNYIDELEEFGRGDYKPQDQYGVLFWTLDQLVNRYGDVGVFHVNDLYEEYAIFATQKLMDYAISKGYDSVIIEAVPGDYQLIDSEKTLSLYGKSKYSSAHLKNPEVSLYHDRMDGDQFFASEKSREQTRSMLKNLANLSENGLYLFILYHENFIPLEERTEFMEKGVFYNATNEWDSVPYIFPEGNVIEKDIGRVYQIRANND